MADGSTITLTLEEQNLVVTESSTPALLPTLPSMDAWPTFSPLLLPLLTSDTAFNPITSIDLRGLELVATHPSGDDVRLANEAVDPASFMLPPALDVGWFAWNRESHQFEVNTDTGVVSFPPSAFISNGRLLLESVDSVLRTDSQTFWVANTHGVWRYASDILDLNDSTNNFFPLALTSPRAVVGGFLSNSNLVSVAAGQSLIESPPGQRQVTLQGITFVEDVLNGGVTASVPIDGMPQSAWATTGFLWDNRGSVGWSGNTLLLQSAAGVGSVNDLREFDSGPAAAARTTGRLRNVDGALWLLNQATWHQYGGVGSWSQSSVNPSQNRVLLTTPDWDWSLVNGALQIALSGVPHAFDWQSPGGFGFTSDQLLAASANATEWLVASPAFIEYQPISSGDTGFLDNRIEPLSLDRIEQYSEANQPPLLFGYQNGSALVWGSPGFSAAPIDPEQHRLLAENHRLRFTRSGTDVFKEIWLDTAGSAPGGWSEYTLNDGRLPFDVVTALSAFDNQWLIGTVAGLQITTSGRSFGLTSIDAMLDLRGAAGGPATGVIHVTIPVTRPHVVVVESDVACVERSAGNVTIDCTQEVSPDRALRVDSDLWQWERQVSTGQLIGNYSLANGSLDSTPIVLDRGRWPHDRIDAMSVCGGHATIRWNGRYLSTFTSSSISLASAPQTSVFDESLGAIGCITAPVTYDDASIPAGVAAWTQSGQAMRLNGSTWTPVTNQADAAHLRDLISNPPILQRNRLMVLENRPGTDGMVQQTISKAWRPLPWALDTLTATWAPAFHIWQSIAVVDDRWWAATSDGLLPLNWSNDTITIDLDQLHLVALPTLDPGLCITTDFEQRTTTTFLRCGANSAHVFAGILSTTRDTGIFLPETTDPFATDTLIDEPGRWTWRLVDRVGGSHGRLEAHRHAEPIVLSAGQFGWDALSSQAFADDGIQDIASEMTGWYRLPAGNLHLTAWDRPSTPANASAYTAVSVVWPSVLDPVQDTDRPAPLLCVQASDHALIMPAEDRVSNCQPAQGLDSLWQYAIVDNQLRIISPIAVGAGPLQRTISHGRFTDDLLTGAPIMTSLNHAFIPTLSGVVELDPGLTRRIAIYGGGVFAGLDDGSTPSALALTSSGAVAYLGSGGLYDLATRTLAEPYNWDTADFLVTDIQYTQSGNRRARWWANGLRGWTLFETSGVVADLTELIDVSRFDRVIERRAAWELTDGTLQVTLEGEVMHVSMQGKTIEVRLPPGFRVIDVLHRGDQLFIVGASDVLSMDLNRALETLF